MGWFGYGLYDGDETQTCHIEFLKNAGVAKNDIEANEFLGVNGTVLTLDKMKKFVDNLNKVLKKMPNLYRENFIDEDNAIEWQMLLSLFVDNETAAPKEVYEMGVKATNYLMGWHADDFDKPKSRRKVLSDFLKKAEDLYKRSKNTTKIEVKNVFVVNAEDSHKFSYVKDYLKAAGIATGYYEVESPSPYKAVFYLKGHSKEARRMAKELTEEI